VRREPGPGGATGCNFGVHVLCSMRLKITPKALYHGGKIMSRVKRGLIRKQRVYYGWHRDGTEVTEEGGREALGGE
jgi:hypothetical protein